MRITYRTDVFEYPDCGGCRCNRLLQTVSAWWPGVLMGEVWNCVWTGIVLFLETNRLGLELCLEFRKSYDGFWVLCEELSMVL